MSFQSVEYIKVYMRKLFNTTTSKIKIMDNFAMQLLFAIPLWASYNDVMTLLKQQISNFMTSEADIGTDYVIRFL